MSQIEQLKFKMEGYGKLAIRNRGTESGARYKRLFRDTKRLYHAERQRVGREVRRSIK